MARWTINGQIGEVIAKDGYFEVNIAVNKYKPDKENNTWVKDSTIWFKTICDFEPKVQKGDSIVAEGIYVKSNDKNLPYQMKISHIGVIQK